MPGRRNMSLVTNAQLGAALAASEARLEQKLEKLEQKLEQKFETFEQKLEQKFETFEQKLEQKLEQKFEKLEQQLEQKLEQKLAAYPTKDDLSTWAGAIEQRMIRLLEGFGAQISAGLSAELGQHVNASNEATWTRVAAVDEKYADLPGRVSALETIVKP